MAKANRLIVDANTSVSKKIPWGCIFMAEEGVAYGVGSAALQQSFQTTWQGTLTEGKKLNTVDILIRSFLGNNIFY
jgi:hypothetical protein